MALASLGSSLSSKVCVLFITFQIDSRDNYVTKFSINTNKGQFCSICMEPTRPTSTFYFSVSTFNFFVLTFYFCNVTFYFSTSILFVENKKKI